MDLIVRAIPRVGSKPVSIAMTAALLAGANLAVWYPGESGPDSYSQYAQAIAGQFDDWHPPIMAWVWSMFRPLAEGDGPMFCFQVVCYWFGFGVIAIALAQAGRSLAAWAMLGVALFPSMLTLNGVLLKDVGMGVTFLAAVGALFWWRKWLSRPWRLLAISIPFSLAMIPAANLFNYRILHAEALRPIRSLQIFDLAGIAFYSGDMAVLGSRKPFSSEEVRRCYTPVGWDNLAPWGECRLFWNRLAVSPDLHGIAENLDARAVMGAKPNPDLSHLWIAAIVRHPVAYATHRLANFSSEIGRGASMGTTDPAPPKPLWVVLYDLITASALWLAIGLGLLIQLACARSVRRTASIDAALALLLSGLTYASAYLIIGVGTELRYLFWSLIAIFTALVISSSEIKISSGRTSWARRSVSQCTKLLLRPR